jgi:molybdopterin/thiamine biosynthesis adenylyltransferase
MNPQQLARYSRQILIDWIGEAGQERLLAGRVAIVGCGALGSAIANSLARAGVGFLRIVDRDIVELQNLQRQALFDEEDARISRPKAVAAADKLKRINSDVKVEAFVDDVNHRTVEHFLRDIDCVLDGTDNLETRFLINEACAKQSVPWVYGGCVASVGMTMSFIPGQTACFQCLVPHLPLPGQLPTCENIGILNSVPQIIGAIEAAEAIKVLVGAKAINSALIIFDLASNSFTHAAIERSPDCRVCQRRDFEFLRGEHFSAGVGLCGRDAVQILPDSTAQLDLEALQIRLSKLGNAQFSGYVLKFSIKDYEMTIFPDGRALIKGTSDPAKARSLYSRYVGN